jgi:predicted nucleic acid-binding protein
VRIVDTNVIVALIVDDRAEQQEAALVWGEHAANEGDGLLVTESVLVEVCWVLERSHSLARRAVAETVALIALTPPFTPWNPDLAERALALMSRRPALSITDCLLAQRAARDDASILTFDTALCRGLNKT